MRRRYKVLVGLTVIIAGLYAANNPWSARPSGEFRIMAHRGVHHTYPTEGLGRDTCTADRIHPPIHGFIENTLASMAEAVRLGADVIEIDVHPTTDGDFAVFHDWTLECRTEAEGVTRDQRMTYLRTLDVGYGYTADGGRTYPLRGKGIGMIPSLDDVLDAFPDTVFMINVKSNDRTEADRLHAYLERRDERGDRLTFFAGERPAAGLRELRPNARIATKAILKDCMQAYMLTGWTGRVPPTCHDTSIFLPATVAPFVWGWPDRSWSEWKA